MIFNRLKNLQINISLAFLLLGFQSCKKFIAIPPPVSSITTSQVFNSDAQVNSALAGIYTKMNKDGAGYGVFSNGATTIFGGLSSDEFLAYDNTGNNFQFSSNTLQSTDNFVLDYFWTPPYFYIYQANAILSGLSLSAGTVDDSARREFNGEAKFIRAFCFFYLTNLFGDVPLTLTTDFNQIAGMARTPQTQVYTQIIQDLRDAQALLPIDYSVGLGERIRPNKWAATALLARAYLYQKEWDSAESQSTAVLANEQLYKLVPDLTHVFDRSSMEAIWQLQLNVTTSPNNLTIEGSNFIPLATDLQGYQPADWIGSESILTPQFYLSNELENAFETNDQRNLTWVHNTLLTTKLVNGQTYYYPFKYNIGAQQQTDQGPASQYYMMLRLAEQYLIRAEARAQKGINLSGAIEDLNTIRARAGLQPFTTATTGALLSAIYHERQVELFGEWGHRWFDLKRTGQAGNVLGAIKPGWDSHDELYPIPRSEISLDPQLTQNKGY